MPSKLNTALFIERARAVHGDKYDYSQVVYVKSSIHVQIICAEHGYFSQLPSMHLSGRGCVLCGYKRVSVSKTGTTNSFVARARFTHGDRYDYTQAIFIDSLTKVKIICPEHGIFMQQPGNHIQGHRCPTCAYELRTKNQTKTIDDFLIQARKIHGEKYNYSLVVFRTRQEKIKIICSVHGVFKQAATNHLMGRGCAECAGCAKLNTETFIDKATAFHGRKYDYSQVIYRGNKHKVKIICPEHGVFEQKPNGHMLGSGCRHCFRKKLIASNTLTTENFLGSACATHGYRYDYSQVVYRGVKYKVKIICPEHGVFEQSPRHHIDGFGCSHCSGTASISAEEFLTRARDVHGDTYDYSQTVYISRKDKVKIICRVHGFFEQLPSSHMAGQGCAQCGRERTNAAVRLSWIEQAKGRECILYFLRFYNEREEFFKVGISSLSIEERYRTKKSLGGYKYEVIAQHKSYNALAIYEWEQSILETFAHLCYQPKNNFGGETECFSSCEEILSIFPL